MKIKFGNPKKGFYFRLNKYDRETDLLCKIEKEKKRWLWIAYANAQHDKRVWKKKKGKYQFCFQIPKIITLETAHLGKKLIGRINLTRLLKKDYQVYSSKTDCMEMGCD